MYSYIEALEKLVLDLGGKIHISSPVDEIIFKDHTAIGIKVKNKRIHSDLVVCSSDYSYSINNLIKNKCVEAESIPNSISKLEHSCSTFILYLALDKKFPSLNVHNIFINKNFRKNINSPFKGKLSPDPSL